MSGLLAAAFVTALAAALLALALGHDPTVRRRLEVGPGGGARRGRPRRLGPRSDPRIWTPHVLAAAGALLGVLPGGRAGEVLIRASLLGAAGWVLPRFLRARAQSRRGAVVRRQVPELFDVLAVCASAGLTPRLSLDRAASAVPPPLGLELAAAARDVALGDPWPVALRRIGARSKLEELPRLARLLERGERLGAPLSARLRPLAREIREARRAELEEAAGRAPVLMLFPLVLCILPAFLLAAVIPAVLAAARGLG